MGHQAAETRETTAAFGRIRPPAGLADRSSLRRQLRKNELSERPVGVNDPEIPGRRAKFTRRNPFDDPAANF